MSLVRKLAITTTIATFLLITIGASVRASGAGLGCPDWPRCYGRWIPPTSADQVEPPWNPAEVNIAKTWTEYLNRLAGIVIGLLVVSTTLAAWLRCRRRRDIVWPATAALLLTGFQGWQGGQVVRHELDPRLVTGHLVVALVIVALLLHVTIATREPRLERRARPLSRARRRLEVVARWALGAGVVQVILGALVRGTIEIVMAERPDLPREAWLAEVGIIDLIHRDAALVAAGLTGWAAWLTWRPASESGRALRLVAAANAGCVAAQLGVGLGLAYGGLPAVLQVAHITLASWLIGGLFVQVVLVGRQEPRRLVADAAP